MLPLLPDTSYTITITGVKDTAGNQMTGTVREHLYHRTYLRSERAIGGLVRSTTKYNWSGHKRSAAGGGLEAPQPAQRRKQLERVIQPRLSPAAKQRHRRVRASYSQPVVRSDRGSYRLPLSRQTRNMSFILEALPTISMWRVTRASHITSYFTTGSGADTTAAKVSTISPVNNQTGAPLNAQIVAVISDAIDPPP